MQRKAGKQQDDNDDGLPATVGCSPYPPADDRQRFSLPALISGRFFGLISGAQPAGGGERFEFLDAFDFHSGKFHEKLSQILVWIDSESAATSDERVNDCSLVTSRRTTNEEPIPLSYCRWAY